MAGPEDRARADEALLTYRQLAERLGITPDSARSKARRRRWNVTLDNQGVARVRVPLDALPVDQGADPERSPAAPRMHPGHDELRRAQERIASLEVELIEAKAAAEAAERRAEVEIAAERRVAAAEVAAKAALVDELRALLAETRRPWWRKLLG
jgi:hypothetical protein